MSAVSKLAAEARGRAGGPHGSHLPRHLALFYPDKTLGRGRSPAIPGHFPIPSRGVTSAASSPAGPMHPRVGVGAERSSSRVSVSTPLIPITRVLLVSCLDARSGRVLSDRKRSALPVKFD